MPKKLLINKKQKQNYLEEIATTNFYFSGYTFSEFSQIMKMSFPKKLFFQSPGNS